VISPRYVSRAFRLWPCQAQAIRPCFAHFARVKFTLYNLFVGNTAQQLLIFINDSGQTDPRFIEGTQDDQN
jgi:hypothetical protein